MKLSILIQETKSNKIRIPAGVRLDDYLRPMLGPLDDTRAAKTIKIHDQNFWLTLAIKAPDGSISPKQVTCKMKHVGKKGDRTLNFSEFTEAFVDMLELADPETVFLGYSKSADDGIIQLSNDYGLGPIYVDTSAGRMIAIVNGMRKDVSIALQKYGQMVTTNRGSLKAALKQLEQ